MRIAMNTTPMTLLLNDTSSVPTFPVAMLGLQSAAFEAPRRRCPIDETILVWQMAALWSDDQTSCDAALWSDDHTSSDAALWADNWPIVN
jgi:hypothetical protein